MKRISLFILLGSITLVSCKKKLITEGDLDKQIIVYFLEERINVMSDYFEAGSRGSILKDFDRRDYKNIDSITLNVGIMTTTLADTATVRLYNITDHEEIADSRVSGSTTWTGFVEFNSNNILRSIPEKKIDIAVQISNKLPGVDAFGLHPYLKLRRK